MKAFLCPRPGIIKAFSISFIREVQMSRKKFNLDELEVQSFETTSGGRPRPTATVRGQTEIPIELTGWNDPACNPYYTMGSSCQAGGESCDGCPTSFCTSFECGPIWTSQCAFSEAQSPCGTGHCLTVWCTDATCHGVTCGGATCPACP